MELDKKPVLRRAVREYVSATSPEQLEEFEVVFDDVYQAVHERMETALQTEEAEKEEGLPFDAGVLIGTAISTACWIGMYLLVAITKYAAKRGAKCALDDVEDRLVRRGEVYPVLWTV